MTTHDLTASDSGILLVRSSPQAPGSPVTAVGTRGDRVRVPFGLLAGLGLGAILGLPGAFFCGLWAMAGSASAAVWIGLVAAPLTLVIYGLAAGAMGWCTRKSIVCGKVRRDLGTAAYRNRRLYGLAWTCVYYAKPVYHLFLSVPALKRALFRLFGYQGSLDFTTYPDTWIRDLPLLELGAGAYISNRATLGTNIVFPGGRLLVDRVRIGREALVGHLCMLAPGARLGPEAELGVGSALGIRARVGARAKIGPQVDIEHGVTVGEDTTIGIRSYVGSGSSLGPGLTIPPATVIPARTRLDTQRDVEELLGMGSGRRTMA